jgi:hypothetical protein
MFAGVVVALSGCASFAQNPGAGWNPVNAVSEGSDKHVMLAGRDVVNYFTDKAERQGLPEIKSDYRGVTFRFASVEHKRMFDAAPEKYIPQFGGYCTNGIVYGIPWGGGENFEIIDGKLYMFGGHGSRDAFLLDVPRNMALANKYWNEEIEGSNAFLQRSYRLTFRVPHYKTGKELAEEVAKAKKS